MADWFRSQAFSGAMPVAVAVAVLAGMASFLSPCVLPLVPGYLAYMTGLSGAELQNQRRLSRVLAGTLLFLGGLTFVMMTEVVTFGTIGSWLVAREQATIRVLGALVVALGLIYMDVIPGFQREFRLHFSPGVGLGAAPVVGMLMGIGWTPCIGPTLGTVIGLSSASGTVGRGMVLGLAYSIGLGVPFLVVGLTYSRSLRAIKLLRSHQVWVMRAGGGLLVTVGLLFVTGYWEVVTSYIQTRLLDTPLSEFGSGL